MKKLSKLLIGLLCFYIGITSVNAATNSCGDAEKLYASGEWEEKSVLSLQHSSGSLDYYLYKMQNSGGTIFASFCRNSGWKSTASSKTFTCKETLLTGTSDIIKQAYEAGVIAILKNGYSPNKNGDDVKEYAATNVALRSYEMLWKDFDSNASNNTIKNKAHRAYSYLWLDDAELAPLIKSINGTKTSISLSEIVYAKAWIANGKDITDDMYPEIKRLVKLAFEAAKKIQDNGGIASIDGLEKDPKPEKYPTEESGGVTTYKTVLTYTFDIKGFSSNTAYVKFDFKCEECEAKGVTTKFQVNGEDTTLPLKIDKNSTPVKLDSEGNLKLEFAIEFTAKSSEYDCSNINYELDVEYYDESFGTKAYTYQAEGCGNNTTCQKFYVLYVDGANLEETSNNAAVKVEIKDDLKLCNTNCTQLKKDCEENHNQEACNNYEEQCSNECTAYVSNATCSPDDTDFYVKEGHKIENSTCNIENTEKASVLSCVIDKKDVNNNSYEATKLVNNNEYCSVYCKEDYDFHLPGIKAVNSDRYFTLKLGISGTKKCYTNEIDRETFVKDYDNLRGQVIQAYNKWAELDAIVNHATESYLRTDTGTTGYTAYGTCTPPLGSTTCVPPCNSYITGYCSAIVMRRSYSWTEYDKLGNPLPKNDHKDFGKVDTTNSGSGCGNSWTCKAITAKEHYDSNDFPGQLANAATTLSGLITQLKNLRDKFNECAKWDEKWSYDFDPEISYWYEEVYMASTLTQKLDTVGSIQDSGKNTQRCESDTDEYYEECNKGWTGDSLMKAFNYGEDPYHNDFTCYASGSEFECGWKNNDQSYWTTYAKRMKVENTKKGEYITPTQFYTIATSGQIVAAPEGTDIENSSVLKSALPVGLGTTQGVYTYVLQIANLGEYYDSSELGRIWGKDPSVVTNISSDASCQNTGDVYDEANVKSTTFENGAYVCSYKINCPDCPVECDPDGCSNSNCPEGNCPTVCDGCIYTNNKTNIDYRPITSTNINPNDRNLGVNWSYNTGIGTSWNINTAMALKAYVTTEEIKELGESVYDIDFDNNTASNYNGYSMKVTMNSKMISAIRNYNDRNSEDGYLNATLKCYDHVDGTGTTYKNIYCYSTFLDELLANPNLSELIKINGTRLSNENERKSQTQSSGYWTTWTEANTSNINTNTQIGLNYQSNYKNIGIGPAWK